MENIGLRDGFPWQIASLLAQLIAQAREFLLLDQELLARVDPLSARHHFVIHRHATSRRKSVRNSQTRSIGPGSTRSKRTVPDSVTTPSSLIACSSSFLLWLVSCPPSASAARGHCGDRRSGGP